MSRKKYLKLTSSATKEILRSHGFVSKRKKGSHEQWEGYVEGKRMVVTVPDYKPESNDLMKSMVEQSGLGHKRFYGTIKKIANRAGVKYIGEK